MRIMTDNLAIPRKIVSYVDAVLCFRRMSAL